MSEAALEGEGSASGEPTSGVVRQLLTFLANVAILTALLVYFGWRLTEHQAVSLGFDETVLGMSTQDYVLRSVGPVVFLLAALAVAALVLLRLDVVVRKRLGKAASSPLRRRLFLFGLATAWLVLPLGVYLIGGTSDWAHVAFPASIGLGVLLLAYQDELRADVGDEGLDRAHRSWQRLLTVCVLVLTLFWTTSNYAEVLGYRGATRIAATLPTMTAVTLHSKEDLALTGRGVHVTRSDGTAYPYRYSGLRLYLRTAQGYALLPRDWSYGDGSLIVIPADAPVRYEFVKGNANN